MKKLIITILTAFCTFISAIASPVDVNYDNGVYHILITGNKIKKKIEFVSSANLITNQEAHRLARSILTVNAGFFDPKNQKTISYITNDI